MKILLSLMLGSMITATALAETKSPVPPAWIANGEESWERGERLREEKRLTEASDSFLNGCKKSHGESCFEYARDSERRGLLKRAARFYGYACDLNIKRSCIKSAELWKKRGETALAAKVLKKGCALGETAACNAGKDANGKTAIAH